MLDSLSENRGTPGRPRFSVGQKVRFSVYNEETEEREYMYGEVYIVDAYGTFFNPGSPSYDIYVVNSKRYVEKLRALSLKELNRDCMYGARTIILVAGPRDDFFTPQDCSCVLENMFVAANALKIASCWINQFDDLFQSKDGLKIKKSLGIPEDYRIVGSCALGYPSDGNFPPVKKRKDDFVKVL